MDLDEWELLSDDGFLVDLHDDGGGKKISHRSHISNPKSVFNMNYFICPSPPPPSQKFTKPTENPNLPNQLVPVPIQLHPPLEKPQGGGDILEKIKAPTPSFVETLDGDQENLPQVSFKKMKENEFVDMKMDSPKSSSRGIMLQIDPGKFQFDDKRGDAMEIMPISPKLSSSSEKEMVIKPISPKMKRDTEMVIKNTMDSDTKKEEVNWEDNNGGLNLLKWGLTGVGALCSIGVAAATICILIFGNTQKNKHQQKNQKLRFQIYTDDKRIKQVVQHATRLNETISAVRGVPLARAHITFGGYYDGL